MIFGEYSGIVCDSGAKVIANIEVLTFADSLLSKFEIYLYKNIGWNNFQR